MLGIADAVVNGNDREATELSDDAITEFYQ
jgi:hypothetical protein